MELKQPEGKSSLLLYGLGVTGKSIIEYFPNFGWKVYIYTDNPSDLNSIDEKNIGTDNLIKVRNIDKICWGDIAFIVKAPVISLDKPLIKKAESMGIDVISDIELAYRIFGGKRLIAITGSNGKTTTTSLVTHILNQSGVKAYSCGNIGYPIFKACKEANEEDYMVCECSSFQLASVSKFKPNVAAILNISPDHLDWHGSYENYISCKLKISSNLSKEDTLIINGNDEILKRSYDEGAFPVEPVILNFEEDVADCFNQKGFWKLYGKHNIENAIFAYEIARAIGISEDKIIRAIRNFSAPVHRLEYVCTINGIDFINDSKATNVDAAVRGMESIKGNLIIIAGGYDKKVDLTDFYKAFEKRNGYMLLMGQTQELMYDQMSKMGLEDRLFKVKNMREAVDISWKLAKPGDKILLSPACASWGLYNNFEERGDDFKNLAINLK